MSSIVLFGRPVAREALVEFKRAYQAAIAAQQDVFIYDGQEVFVPFAKYLVQYAESQLGEL